MDEPTQARRRRIHDEIETFRSDIRFLLDDMHAALDAADAAPWTTPGAITEPIATAVAAIARRLVQLTERIGPVTCASCGARLGWNELSHGQARCAACTSTYEL